MPQLNLTDAHVRVLKPRKSTYHVRDLKLKGFGVRVLPSGAKRFCLHTQHRGQRSWNVQPGQKKTGMPHEKMNLLL